MATPQTAVSRDAPTDVRPAVRAVTLLRVLAYDRTIATRHPTVHIHVLYRPADAASFDEARHVVRAFNAAANAVRLRGLRATAEAMRADDPGLDQATAASVLSATSALDAEIPGLVKRARANQTPLLGCRRAQVEAGASAVVVGLRGRPSVVVNLNEARATGMRLTAALLRLSEVL
jgi:hypothetical protein